MKEAVLIVLTNCPDVDVADRIAHALVEQRLAACVNRLAAVQSLYRWQGALERAEEVPLLIKTTVTRYAEVEAAIRGLHPYEVPEVLALEVTKGHGPYLSWLDESVGP